MHHTGPRDPVTHGQATLNQEGHHSEPDVTGEASQGAPSAFCALWGLPDNRTKPSTINVSIDEARDGFNGDAWQWQEDIECRQDEARRERLHVATREHGEACADARETRRKAEAEREARYWQEAERHSRPVVKQDAKPQQVFEVGDIVSSREFIVFDDNHYKMVLNSLITEELTSNGKTFFRIETVQPPGSKIVGKHWSQVVRAECLTLVQKAPKSFNGDVFMAEEGAVILWDNPGHTHEAPVPTKQLGWVLQRHGFIRIVTHLAKTGIVDRFNVNVLSNDLTLLYTPEEFQQVRPLLANDIDPRKAENAPDAPQDEPEKGALNLGAIAIEASAIIGLIDNTPTPEGDDTSAYVQRSLMNNVKSQAKVILRLISMLEEQKRNQKQMKDRLRRSAQHLEAAIKAASDEGEP